MKTSLFLRTLLVTTIVSAAGLAGGCTPMTANRGNLLEDFQMQEVKPGLDTRDDVIRKIGSPTTIAPFDDKTWYYLGQKKEKRGILDSQVVQERIVVVTFGEDGFVNAVKERRDGREDVPIVERKTPTSGNEMTVLQQMLGNLGRFNKGSAEGNAATTASGGKNR